VTTAALKGRPQLRLVSGGRDARTPECSDDELIDAFERGDLELSGRLYDRLERVVSATLIKVLGERGQDHDDLMQSAFEQILRTLAQKRFARACSLASWAVSVTTHVALTTIRKRQSQRKHVGTEPVNDELEVGHGPGPEQRAMMSALRSELAKLPPLTAQVIILHEVMGHDLAAVAVLTSLSVSAAQSRLVRGRAELRQKLDSQFPEARR
jgi:RNA polymerase sigma-70 factor (ECF subfamily)